MLFTYELNKLMLIDGVLFAVPGISMMLFPNPRRKLAARMDSKKELPTMIDLRILLGAAYTSLGLIIATMGGVITRTDELNTFAIFRSVSLVFIIYAIGKQITGKKWRWKGTIVTYFIMYTILLFLYAFLGIVDPLPLQI